MYLLDTSVLIEIMNASDAGAEALLEISSEDIGISPISTFEFLKNSKERQFEERKTLLKNIPQLSLDPETAIEAAKIHNKLSKAGKKIGDFDTLIAATCTRNDCTLVTYDRHFSHIPNLKTKILKF